MEPFIDGGLFEILVAGLFTTVINFIFRNRVLLFLYSLLSIASPVLLLFIRSGEAFNYLIALCLFNAIFLVILLWKAKAGQPDAPLFRFSPKQLLRKPLFRKAYKRI